MDKIYVLLLHMLKYVLSKYEGHQYSKRHDFSTFYIHSVQLHNNIKHQEAL